MRTPREGIQYLPHQEDGIRWMLEREEEGFGILADDMGLGKTFQTIGLLKNSHYDYKTLILCPLALINGWEAELRACGFRPRIITPKSSPFFADKPDRKGDVWLTSYSKATYYPLALSKLRFDRVILDEGHVIRNRGALWSACEKIAVHSSARWILSATPVQNGTKDWKNLLAWGRCEDSETLLLRRTMNELRADPGLHLPPPATFVFHDLVIAEKREKELFHLLCNRLLDAKDSSAVNVLEMFLRIQQFIVHPQIYIDAMRRKHQSFVRPDWEGATTKWSKFLSVLEESDEPTIVFCYFRDEMDRVRDAVVGLGRSAFSIRGGMGGAEIGETVRDASKVPGAVVIVQIVSGGCGLNLQFCTRILFLSLHWNPAVVHQAVGRAVRVGQTAQVAVHIFRILDDLMYNVDQRMHDIHGEKIYAARDICESFFDSWVGASWSQRS